LSVCQELTRKTKVGQAVVRSHGIGRNAAGLRRKCAKLASAKNWVSANFRQTERKKAREICRKGRIERVHT